MRQTLAGQSAVPAVLVLTLLFPALLTAPQSGFRSPDPGVINSFTVGTIVAAPGSKASGWLEVPKGVDEGTRIPVTVIHGARSGPVLALVAGTHGYEYAPIVAMQHFPAK